MKRAIILVLDSLGLGSSDDSHLYGDEGSDTFGHIIEECDLGKANRSERSGPLEFQIYLDGDLVRLLLKVGGHLFQLIE